MEELEQIKFYDEETEEELLLEVVDAITLDGVKYILAADENDDAMILKQINDNEEDIEYATVDDDDEFNKAATEFMANDENNIDFVEE